MTPVLTVTLALLTLPMSFLLYLIWCRRHWQRRGIATLKHQPGLLYSLVPTFLGRSKAQPYLVQELYQEVKRQGLKMAGVYQLANPLLLLADTDLIREVMVKNFDHFVDRRSLVTASSDALFSRSLLNLKGDEWRNVRRHLTPAFTGSKLRNMMGLMNQTARQFTDFLLSRLNTNEPLDMRAAFQRFSADTIATTAFGIAGNSLHKPEEEFLLRGRQVFDSSGWRGVVFLGYKLCPRAMAALGLPFMRKDVTDYFEGVIRSTIEYRKRENKSRPDMVQLLVDARIVPPQPSTTKPAAAAGMQTQPGDGGNPVYTPALSGLSDQDIAAQAFTFFLGGLDTVSTTLSFSAHMIASHPLVHARLNNEVNLALSDLEPGGHVTYDLVQSLKYMDMVVSEVLRMYPGVAMTDRICTQELHLLEAGVTVKPGDRLGVPVYALHYDPVFFPEPERFDPERFSEENRAKINSFAYLPFGAGPRNCLGMRFALLEVKLCLVYLLATCHLETCVRTQSPLVLAPGVQLGPKGGFWLTVRPRTDSCVLPA